MTPWGWTWIDDMPWGFATSHFGRWANHRWLRYRSRALGMGAGASALVAHVEEPAFMPAAVAFLGTAGVGLSYPDAFSPAVAWFPLAPGEVYWPSFTDDPKVIRRLNDGAVADPAAIGPARKDQPPADVVTGQYRNRRYASVVPRPVFIGGKPVAEALIELPPRRLENAPLLAGSPGIEPPRIEPLGTTPPVKAATQSAGRGVAANLAKARDMLAHIVKWREHGKRAAEPAVSRAPVPNTLAAEKHDSSKRAVVRKKHGTRALSRRPLGATGASSPGCARPNAARIRRNRAPLRCAPTPGADDETHDATRIRRKPAPEGNPRPGARNSVGGSRKGDTS